ncbi:hypothetical protein [Sediminibacterium sp.]|uniref:hypothetical protein n=1 Tax=Sediminibacterium sp. TaxID=1917865 RepID=UPI003F699792
MKFKNIFIFFVVILLVACKKHDVSKVDQHAELKEWLKQNGEGYKNGVLLFKDANAEKKAGHLNWSQVSTYNIEGIVYTEVPFMFGEENKGELRSNTSEANVDATFYLMLRTINGEIDGAIKVVQQSIDLKANNETKTGTLESFRNLKNELVNIWFRESANNNLIALKLAENQTWANAISSQSDIRSNSCDISYTTVRVITGGGVSLDSSPDNVIIYSVYTETTSFKIDCAGSGSGTEYWPPTPPPSSAGGGPSEIEKDPCEVAKPAAKMVTTLSQSDKYDSAKLQIQNADSKVEHSITFGTDSNGNTTASPMTTCTSSSTCTANINWPGAIADIHNHTNDLPPSPGDLYNLIGVNNKYNQYSTRMVVSKNGAVFALVVIDLSAANRFREKYPPIDLGFGPDFPSEIFDKLDEVKDAFMKKGLTELISVEAAMSYVLDKYNTGMALLKQDGIGNFNRLITNETISNGSITYVSNNCN